MTNPYRAMCAELLRRWDAANGDHDLLDVADAMDRARALLAEAVAEGPTDEELETFLVDVACQNGDMYYADPRVLARAVLARWGRPAAAPVPEPGEVADEELREIAMHCVKGHKSIEWAIKEGIALDRSRRARALLAEPEAEGPSEEELYDLADEFNGDPVPAMRAALDRWGRPAAAPVAMIELITDMSMHLAHMQELLEDYEYGDPEDYHWYRESVRLRAVAAEVLA